MSMTVGLQSPAVTLSFATDTGSGDLVSMDPVNNTNGGVRCPAPVRIVSSTSKSKGGVMRCNIAVRVPLYTVKADASWTTQVYGTAETYVQAALTVTIPNSEGILGSAGENFGVGMDQPRCNLNAVSLALQVLLNLIANNATGVLVSGKAVISNNCGAGMFDEHNPITRGLSNVIPVDPATNRSILS